MDTKDKAFFGYTVEQAAETIGGGIPTGLEHRGIGALTGEQAKEVFSGGGGSGGTSNYNALTNRPAINGTTLSGDKQSSDLGLYSAAQGSALAGRVGTLEQQLVDLDITGLQTDVSGLRTDVSALTTAVSAVQNQSNSNKSRLDTVETDLATTTTTANSARSDLDDGAITAEELASYWAD